MAFDAQQYRGPIEYFDGAMAAAVVRKVKVIRVIEEATFTSLTMQFPSTPATAGAANPSAISFPALMEIWDVAAFRLLTGSIQVVYHTVGSGS